MKLSEIKERLNNCEFWTDLVKITPYRTIADKSAMCNEIVEQCLLTDANGLKYVDTVKKRLGIDLSFIIFYTDIELDMEESNDYLYESGLIYWIIDDIKKNYENEYWFIIQTVDSIIDEQKELNNSIQALIAKGLNTLISKIPDEKSIKKIIADLPKQINKINPQNLEILKGLGKVN